MLTLEENAFDLIPENLSRALERVREEEGAQLPALDVGRRELASRFRYQDRVCIEMMLAQEAGT